MPLDPNIRVHLLRHARSAICAYLSGEPLPKHELGENLPRCGVFVTLRKVEALRGCIGVFSSEDDLPTTIARIAVAATRDPRFTYMPVSLNELSELRIEISLLSALEPMTDPMDFEIGVHGIYISRGHAVGCFLPDVATEHGWDKHTFLTQCCGQKAGLEPDAWRTAGVELFRFTVEKILE
jgi:uncharacterized protein